MNCMINSAWISNHRSRLMAVRWSERRTNLLPRILLALGVMGQWEWMEFCESSGTSPKNGSVQCWNIGSIINCMQNSEPTKRNVVSVNASFLSSWCYVTCYYHIQDVLVALWGEGRMGQATDMDSTLRVRLIMCLTQGTRTIANSPVLLLWYARVTSVSEAGRICDALTNAIAGILYLRLEGNSHVSVKFLASTSQIVPLCKVTTPWVVLLSAVLLFQACGYCLSCACVRTKSCHTAAVEPQN